jgi:hypothetical protein
MRQQLWPAILIQPTYCNLVGSGAAADPTRHSRLPFADRNAWHHRMMRPRRAGYWCDMEIREYPKASLLEQQP